MKRTRTRTSTIEMSRKMIEYVVVIPSESEPMGLKVDKVIEASSYSSAEKAASKMYQPGTVEWKVVEKSSFDKKIAKMNWKRKIPTNMREAKNICKQICKKFNIDISFDDKFGNFGSVRNQCCCHCSIECAKYTKSNHMLLVIGVLHELGHMGGEKSKHCVDLITDSSNQNQFMCEYAAWMWAMENYILMFGENVSQEIAKYILGCLNTYASNPSNFWCPILEQDLL